MVAKKKKKKKNAITNTAVFEAEPLAQLGVGIVTYEHILWSLFAIFALFTIMLSPTMHNFKAGTGYKGENPNFIKYEMSMLGNMGYSSVQCSAVPLDLGKLNVQCPYGTVGEVTHFGVNLNDDMHGNCVENEQIKQCKPDSDLFVN